MMPGDKMLDVIFPTKLAQMNVLKILALMTPEGKQLEILFKVGDDVYNMPDGVREQFRGILAVFGCLCQISPRELAAAIMSVEETMQ